MQIVIDIPDRIYKINQNRRLNITDAGILEKAVRKGTPLPKGHGRLGDLSKVYDKLNEAQIEGTEEYKGLGEAKQILCDVSTIIEADKESEVKG